MWSNLFYDKYAGDHQYNNILTKGITIEDLCDGSYMLLHSGQNAVDYYNTKFINSKKIPDSLLKSKMFKLDIYIKFISGVETIYTVVGINTKIISQIVINNGEIPHKDFLKNLCRHHTRYMNYSKVMASMFYNSSNYTEQIDGNIEFIKEKATKSVDYTFDNMIDDPVDITEQLFQYQKCSIQWMINKEKNIGKIKYNLNDEVIIGEVYYDMYNQMFNHISMKNELIFYGGGLIDEVGLGKTVQIITLSLLNQPKFTSYVRDGNTNKLYSRGTLVICPNQLCGQWVREIQKMVSKEFEPQIITILTKRHFNKYTYQDLLDADFIIVSYTFFDNNAFTIPWISKISKSLSYHKQHWSKTDTINITKLFNEMGEDIVKMGFDGLLMKNPLFQLIHWHRIVIDEFHEIHSTSKYNYINNILPFIDGNFRWCVTATPFINNKNLYNIINFITGYKSVDGENILTNENIVEYTSTSCFRRNTKISVKKEHYLPPINEEIRWIQFTPTERMMYNAYLANPNNDKFSVYLRQLCCHPQLADETKHALSNCKTLCDIEKMMVAHYKKDMDIAQEKVNKIKIRINMINKKIKKIEKKQRKKQLKKLGYDIESESDSNSNSELEEYILLDSGSVVDIVDIDEDITNEITNKRTITIDNLKETLGLVNDKLIIAQNELDGKTTTHDFFNNVVMRLRKTVTKETDKTKISSFGAKLNEDTNIMNLLSYELDNDDNDDDEKCGICLDEICEDDVGVTKCGHIFCYECLKIAISKFHNCPMCRKNLTDANIYLLSYEKPKKKSEYISTEDKAKEVLINEVGTKLANLIFYLRNTNEHTIIFSQWNDMLRKVGRVLAENNIKNVFCKGNCYQRDKAIREFNGDDKIKVIMLSSEGAASGTNLTKATIVILLDPIYGKHKYRKDQEKQAIGRAYRLGQKFNIKVVRFLIKNSVEEEIYWMNNQEDKKCAELKETNNIAEFETSN
jgi:SNF2 family DNA or RNA helicase